MKRKLLILLIILFLFLIFKNYSLVLSSTILATNIWFYKVFPYLFIMLIIVDLLINLDFAAYFKKTSNYIFILSIISGTPLQSYLIGNMVKNNIISIEYANTLLKFTFFANPLFIYTILNSIFSNKYIVFKLIVIIYLTNIIIYFIYKKNLKENNKSFKSVNINLASSIKNSINTSLMVLGVITFYLILSNTLLNSFNINTILNIFIRGIIEMTQGLNSLINTNINYKEFLTIFLINFGGLSIHTQVKCILDEYNLSYKEFLKGRIIAIFISLFLTALSQAI